MKLKKIFQRKENKYLLTQSQFQSFFDDLHQYMSVDQYGLHTIQSLYYDTPDYYFIQRSISKPKYKEKFRVRSYGIARADSLVFLEIKKKVAGIVYKQRLVFTYEEYLNWEVSGKFSDQLTSVQIAREITWLFYRQPTLSPKVLITYDRLSLFMADDSEFRVTFDQNIRYCTENLALDNKPSGKLVAPEVGVLMEVKAMGAYPLWFTALLTKYHIQKSSFLKYAQTYQRHLFKREELLNVV